MPSAWIPDVFWSFASAAIAVFGTLARCHKHEHCHARKGIN